MGLAANLTVSERHEAARNDSTKITAGELARAMRRAGYQVKAADIKDFAPEWHHAGWNPGGGMGRCYFFSAEDMEPARMQALYECVEAKRAEIARVRYGWKVDFRRCRRRYQPIACLRQFEVGENMPPNFSEIERDEFNSLVPFNGCDLEPYESRSDFLARMLAPKLADPFAGERFRLVNRESGAGDQTPPRAPRPLTDDELAALDAADLDALRPLKRRERKAVLYAAKLPTRAEALDEVARRIEAASAP